MSQLLLVFLSGHLLLALYGYFVAKKQNINHYNWFAIIFVFGIAGLGALNIKIGKIKLGSFLIIFAILEICLICFNMSN
jgi:hypothetical protein